MIGYDKIPVNEDILLDLPLREGIGTVTMDVAKPHHPITMHDPGGGSFVWTSLPSGLMVMDFVTVGGGNLDGVYMDSPGAETADLNFIAGAYSLSAWINWTSNVWSTMIMCRNVTLVSGWEVYLNLSGGRNTVSQRNSHSSIVGNTDSNCFSVGWTPGTWAFLGISREAGNLYPMHYRNGVPLSMSYEDSGMLDSDTCASGLVVGARFTKDANWYKGLMWRPRAWNRALTETEWMNIFTAERDWFGI